MITMQSLNVRSSCIDRNTTKAYSALQINYVIMWNMRNDGYVCWLCNVMEHLYV